jgi:cell wall-associated NlpC family hydrolase
MTHWASRYIGDEWVTREHDCWGFVRRVYAEQFGVSVPAVDVDSLNLRASIDAFSGHDERANWVRIDDPEDGCAVLMGMGRHPTHVGIWCDVDGGGVVHAVRKAGVVFQSRASLALAGWAVHAFYRRRECSPPQ